MLLPMPLCYQRLCQSCCAVANAADVCQCYTLLVLLSVFVSAVCCCQAWCWCCHVVLSKAEADSGVLQVWNPGNYCFNVMHLAILLPAAVPSLPLPLSFCPVLSLPLPCPPLPCPALPCPALPCPACRLWHKSFLLPGQQWLSAGLLGTGLFCMTGILPTTFVSRFRDKM